MKVIDRVRKAADAWYQAEYKMMDELEVILISGTLKPSDANAYKKIVEKRTNAFIEWQDALKELNVELSIHASTEGV